MRLRCFCPRWSVTAGDYVMAAIVYGVCRVCVCVSRPLISLELVLGF